MKIWLHSIITPIYIIYIYIYYVNNGLIPCQRKVRVVCIIFYHWFIFRRRLLSKLEINVQEIGSVSIRLQKHHFCGQGVHDDDVILSAMASQITGLLIVNSSVYSGADQRKHQSFASLAFVRGIHRWPANSPHKETVMRKALWCHHVAKNDRHPVKQVKHHQPSVSRWCCVTLWNAWLLSTTIYRQR